jgi:methylated-DNA-[protein]-cysteine S-methyltransferase
MREFSCEATADQCVAFPSRLGWMAAVWGDHGLKRLIFGYRSKRAALASVEARPAGERSTDLMNDLIDRLQAYAQGESDDLQDVEVDLSERTPFQRSVLTQCRRIARGHILTYGELAVRAGSPRSARAVGSVMASNPIPLIIPCHRVVAARGSLGGFSAPGGLSMKRRLLEMEGALPRQKSLLAAES